MGHASEGRPLHSFRTPPKTSEKRDESTRPVGTSRLPSATVCVISSWAHGVIVIIVQSVNFFHICVPWTLAQKMHPPEIGVADSFTLPGHARARTNSFWVFFGWWRTLGFLGVLVFKVRSTTWGMYHMTVVQNLTGQTMEGWHPKHLLRFQPGIYWVCFCRYYIDQGTPFQAPGAKRGSSMGRQLGAEDRIGRCFRAADRWCLVWRRLLCLKRESWNMDFMCCGKIETARPKKGTSTASQKIWYLGPCNPMESPFSPPTGDGEHAKNRGFKAENTAEVCHWARRRHPLPAYSGRTVTFSTILSSF